MSKKKQNGTPVPHAVEVELGGFDYSIEEPEAIRSNEVKEDGKQNS